MPKSPIRVQRDLEQHLRVYVDVLTEKGMDVEVGVLLEAINIIQQHYYAVLPTQNRFKQTVCAALYDSSPGLLSIDDLVVALRRARLVSDRSRIQPMLGKAKREGELTNPVRGHWTITAKGKRYVEAFRAKQARKKTS